MSFLDLASRLTALLPGLPPVHADQLINDAWRDVRSERLWSFLQRDAGIFCPVAVTTGTVAITQFDTTITFNAAASTALATLAASLPGNVGLTSLQIRFGSSSNAQVGQIYNIDAIDISDPTAYAFTLNRIVMEATAAAATYTIYRCYIDTPDDFLKWTSVVDMTNGYPLALNYTSAYFDLRDPQRTSASIAYAVGAYQGDTFNSVDAPAGRLARYEFWPHPTSGQTFYARYIRRGTDFATIASEPDIAIPDQLILQRALYMYAYPWAQANVGHFPSLKSLNFPLLIGTSKNAYFDLLIQAKKQDDEQQLSRVWNRGHGLVTGNRAPVRGAYTFPVDSNYIQNHLVNL